MNHDISKETSDALTKALTMLANEVLEKTGGDAALIDIRVGAPKFGPAMIALGIQVIGCQHHNHGGAGDRPGSREEGPYTEPAQDPAAIAAELLRQLRRARGN